MDPTSSTGSVRKHEDPDESKNDKRDVKPVVVKTLNRVPRACNACRKQKMRCEGADNPPCRRCRNGGLECLFEKPSREATLTGEAGLERIRSLEAHVADIRQGQAAIQNTLAEIVGHLRNGTFTNRSPSVYPQPYHHQSPSMHSPAVSTPPGSQQNMGDISNHQGHNTFNAPHGPIMNAPPTRQARGPGPNQSYQSPSMNPGAQTSPVTEYNAPQVSPAYPAYPPGAAPAYGANQGPVLPPFSSIQTMGPPGSQQGNVSNVRYDNGQPQRPGSRLHSVSGSSKRQAPGSSNVTSADSSDLDDDDGELPAHGLVAPWEVLRGLADVAIERAAKENGEGSESRTRPPSQERQSRPAKRRKIRHKALRNLVFPDVVTKNIITEDEARELFRIFYHGCSTFLPVFDSNTDTFEALHERSPFAVDCICMVAARVRDGGGKASEIYTKCLEEVHQISCATLFSPVTRNEAVQAMILVSGWSDNGWLSGGHAVRMAMELSMHQAWPKLLKRMNENKSTDSEEDRNLVIQSRTWFCLYLFEHQLSYGTGRPAVLKDDESIRHCRLLLRHPLAIEDDMRLVSTVELMAVREEVHNSMAPFEGPVDDEAFAILQRADVQFQGWYTTWDQAFSQKYEDAAFYRQSLQIQHLHAELFHNATALRGINGPDDVHNMPQVQRDLAIRSIQIARQGLDITVNSPAYREGMKYAVHYTHATATFAASFLLRLARLFPDECDMQDIKTQVERLAALMAEIPGKRYALTLQVMLKTAKKRKGTSSSRSPKTSRDHRPMDHQGGVPVQHRNSEPFSPTYDVNFANQQHMNPHPQSIPPPPMPHQQDADHIWQGFAMTSTEQLPVWISDQSLGGNMFSQHGMNAFLLPADYLPSTPQIW